MTGADSADPATYIWDAMYRPLGNLFWEARKLLLTDQVADRNLASACHYFFSKAERRHLAVQQLLPLGLYAEVMPLVRNGFEDWVNAAYIFRDSAGARWKSYLDDTNIADAKVLRGLSQHGILDLEDYRARLTEAEHTILDPHLDEERKRWQGHGLAKRAASVGLSKAYDLAYPYLCEYTHGGSRHYWECLENETLSPRREPAAEQLPAVWTIWYHLRVVQMCVRPYGAKKDHSVDFRANVVRNGYGAYITEPLITELAGG
jgi:hypothetical protein